VSYNTQKDQWFLDELISHCVQEEEMLMREKTKSAHPTTSSQNKRKRTAENSSQNKKAKEQPMESTCVFCKKTEHMKNNCSKYTVWCERMGSLWSCPPSDAE